jgi:hypothetical protein|nr:hypothetical protein [uncultured Capnocytophaga sp.]
MNIPIGLSIYVSDSDNTEIEVLNSLRDENTLFFNVWTDYSMQWWNYFKNKKKNNMPAIFRPLLYIFYCFFDDVKIKRELSTLSESSNKKFMCIKDLLNDTSKVYIIGNMGFDNTTTIEILDYLFLFKKQYKILFISTDNSLETSMFYENVDMKIIRKIYQKK